MIAQCTGGPTVPGEAPDAWGGAWDRRRGCLLPPPPRPGGVSTPCCLAPHPSAVWSMAVLSCPLSPGGLSGPHGWPVGFWMLPPRLVLSLPRMPLGERGWQGSWGRDRGLFAALASSLFLPEDGARR